MSKNSKKKKPKKKTKVAGMGSFASGAFWRVLDPDEEVAEEPLNKTFKKPRAPTIEERDAEFIPVK